MVKTGTRISFRPLLQAVLELSRNFSTRLRASLFRVVVSLVLT